MAIEEIGSSSPSHPLPKDNVIMILAKLPLKSLCRFKCVSKEFQDMIRKDVFKLKFGPKTPLLLTAEDDDKLCTYLIDEDGSSATLFQTLNFDCFLGSPRINNGFLCFKDENDLFNVYNLQTKEEQIFELPSFQSFDFGLDPLSGKFKMLLWSQEEENGKHSTNFAVFTINKDLIPRPLNTKMGIRNLGKSHCLLSGKFYWLIQEMQQIISFCLSEERFEVTMLPDSVKPKDHTRSQIIFVWEGFICLAIHKPALREERVCEINSIWFLSDINKNFWVQIVQDLNFTLDNEVFCMLGSVGTRWVPRDVELFARDGEINILACDNKGFYYLFEHNLLSQEVRRTKIKGLPEFISLQRYDEGSYLLEKLGDDTPETESDEDTDEE